MTESKTNGQPDESATAKQTRAVGVFPRVSLKKAQELADAIYKLGEGETVRRLSVFNELQRAADSGPSRMLVTTAGGGYGLTTGSYKADKLGLTTRGISLASSTSDAERLPSAYDALFANDIFSSFVGRFKEKGFPNKEIAIDFLKTSFKLSDTDAAACLAVIKENVEDWGLVQEYSGRKIVATREMALEEAAKNAHAERPPTLGSENGKTAESAALDRNTPKNWAGDGRPTAPQIHFNIQIHLPESATLESYDAIFKSIATHLLRQNDTVE